MGPREQSTQRQFTESQRAGGPTESMTQNTASDVQEPPLEGSLDAGGNLVLDAAESPEAPPRRRLRGADDHYISHANAAAHQVGTRILHVAGLTTLTPLSILKLQSDIDYDFVMASSPEQAKAAMAHRASDAVVIHVNREIDFDQCENLIREAMLPWSESAHLPRIVVVADEPVTPLIASWQSQGMVIVVSSEVDIEALRSDLAGTPLRAQALEAPAVAAGATQATLLEADLTRHLRDEPGAWQRAMAAVPGIKGGLTKVRRLAATVLGRSANGMVELLQQVRSRPKKAPTEKARRALLVGLVMLLVLFAAGYMLQDHQHGNTVEVVQAEQGALFINNSYVGDVVSQKASALRTPLGGLVDKVLVSRGDSVTAGQALVRFDTREQRIKIGVARAKLLSLQRQLETARSALNSMRAASLLGTVTRQSVDTFALEVGQLESQKMLADQELDLARFQLAKMEVKAPFDGRVTDVFVVPGAWVEADQHLLSVMDPAALAITVTVPSADAAFLQVGQEVKLQDLRAPAVVHTDAISGIDGLESEKARISIALDKDKAEFALDQPVLVTINPAQTQLILLPAEAVKVVDDKTVVAIEEAEKIRLVPVTVGRKTARRVEILDGLQPGQHVVLSHQPLEDGQHVHSVSVSSVASR